MYIRTIDDRLIHIGDEGAIREFKGKLYAFKDKFYAYRAENGWEVKAQSEFIEPLMDQYIAVKKQEEDGKLVWTLCPTPLDPNPSWDCYGCVLTKKGLIYVAKVNAKGKLELL